MKRLLLSLFALVFIFYFNVTVLADEGHSDDNNVRNATAKFKNGTIDDESKDFSENPSTNSVEEDTDVDESEHEQHAEEGTHEEEVGTSNHHGSVVETPPNYKVLGSFGVVNLSFVLIGVWNKWLRRKVIT